MKITLSYFADKATIENIRLDISGYNWILVLD